MQRISKVGFVAVAVAGLTLAAMQAAAGLATWDQARVTSIAQDLAKACEGWWTATRQQGGDTVGSGDAMDANSIGNKARVLQEMSASLANHLKEGWGHDKTADLYRSLKEVVDDTEQAAQRAELDEPTMDAWAKVADAVRQIAPYYDPNADAGR